jgi:putative hydrolase of the HAD superfamily
VKGHGRSAPGRAGRLRPAVLLDALGTLVELQPPAPRLRARLAEEGFEVSEERAAAGFAAEISYYLAHHLEGADRERLDDLRDRCAAAMMDALDLPGLDHATARRAMLGALEFTAFPDALEGLADLRERGHRLVVVSNWDCSLPDWLGPTGLLDRVDGVVTSAEVGAAKPDPAVFRKALSLAGVDGAGAVHVGDSLDNDVAGARALGIRAILVQREGEPPPGVESVRALTEVATLV